MLSTTSQSPRRPPPSSFLLHGKTAHSQSSQSQSRSNGQFGIGMTRTFKAMETSPPPQVPGGWGYLTQSFVHEQSDCFSNKFSSQSGSRQGDVCNKISATMSNYYSGCENNVVTIVQFLDSPNCTGSNWQINTENFADSCNPAGSANWMFLSCYNSDPSVTVPQLYPAPPEGTTYAQYSFSDNKTCTGEPPTFFQAFVSGVCQTLENDNVTYTCNGSTMSRNHLIATMPVLEVQQIQRIFLKIFALMMVMPNLLLLWRIAILLRWLIRLL